MGKLLWATVILILIIVGMIIVNSRSIKLDESEGRNEFAIEYGKWIFKSMKNFVSIVGYAIDQDWGVDDSANETGGGD